MKPYRFQLKGEECSVFSSLYRCHNKWMLNRFCARLFDVVKEVTAVLFQLCFDVDV